MEEEVPNPQLTTNQINTNMEMEISERREQKISLDMLETIRSLLVELQSFKEEK